MIVPIYTGVFVDTEALWNIFPPKLSVRKGHAHVTLSYRGGVESAHEEWLGEKVLVKVVAYGNNGKNEGLKVELESSNSELQKYLDALGEHHITLSYARDSDPKFTANLDFEELNEKIELVGVYEVFTSRGFIKAPS